MGLQWMLWRGWGYNACCGGGGATIHDVEGVGLQCKMWRGGATVHDVEGVGLQYVVWRGEVWLQCIGEGVGLNGMMQAVCGACAPLTAHNCRSSSAKDY